MLEPEIKPNGNARKPETAFEKEVARKSKDNPKSFWKYVNTKLKYKDNVADLNTEGVVASSDQQKAKALSDFYKQVSTNEDTSNVPHFEPRKCDSVLENVEITIDDVKELLQDLIVNKSQGPDLLHPRLLFEARNEISKPLFLIFRMSLNTGILPGE